ncbi:hypothetical protein BDV12DRAFT_177697 [Aspergillus spectabilis]
MQLWSGQKRRSGRIIKGNTLTTKGHSELESKSENPEQSWWYSERSVGDFRRSFAFPVQ